ncbi:hypothetical protein ARMSODRAFT_1016175 [Armillaria solidipes]|uniref:Uncharacterized protein n=1 Tax=Armillaria solidipes TaxID=1076256 RepID=A0A2H3BMV3_9AGAR|nr:hypothetical protein ARMSODRAFT_1016175 [Armillaria solidipes]
MTPDLTNAQTIALSTAVVGATLIFFVTAFIFTYWRRQIESFLYRHGVLTPPGPSPLRPAPFPAHYILPYQSATTMDEPLVQPDTGTTRRRANPYPPTSSDEFPPRTPTPPRNAIPGPSNVPRTPSPTPLANDRDLRAQYEQFPLPLYDPADIPPIEQALAQARPRLFIPFPTARTRIRPPPGRFPTSEPSSSEDDSFHTAARRAPAAHLVPAPNRFITIHTDDEDDFEHTISRALEHAGTPDAPISVSSGSERSYSPIPDDALPFANDSDADSSDDDRRPPGAISKRHRSPQPPRTQIRVEFTQSNRQENTRTTPNSSLGATTTRRRGPTLHATRPLTSHGEVSGHIQRRHDTRRKRARGQYPGKDLRQSKPRAIPSCARTGPIGNAPIGRQRNSREHYGYSPYGNSEWTPPTPERFDHFHYDYGTFGELPRTPFPLPDSSFAPYPYPPRIPHPRRIDQYRPPQYGTRPFAGQDPPNPPDNEQPEQGGSNQPPAPTNEERLAAAKQRSAEKHLRAEEL